MSDYYYLIAGLPDVSLDDGKLNYTVENFKTDIYPSLNTNDKELIDLFYLKYDNENVLKLLKDKEAAIETIGNYTVDQLTELINTVKEDDRPEEDFPEYLIAFLSEYFQTQGDDTGLPENAMARYYYEYAMKSNNQFISSWFEFNLDLNNLLAALTARKYKIEIAANVVGETETSEAIRTSNARDFGLSGSLSYFEDLIRVNDITELVEREKKIDLLKWNWLEEESFFNYFSIEKLFVFLVKLEMIERWITLDKETGRKLFRKLIDSLKQDVQIPEEFRK